MKGALSYLDFNRIEGGMQELATTLGVSITTKTNWTVDGYLTASDASRWLNNVRTLRKWCSAMSNTPSIPNSMNNPTWGLMNQIEKVLFDIEHVATDLQLYASEPFCGGEPYYALC